MTTLDNATTNSWLLPPRTVEVPFDAQWFFVGKKEKPCRPGHPDDGLGGDCWDHVALDPEPRLVVSVVVGRRTSALTYALVEDCHRRTGGRLMNLMTSDENPVYAEALRAVYGQEVPPQRTGHRGRPRAPYQVWPEGLVSATVPKVRPNHRVVKVATGLVFGTAAWLALAWLLSWVSARGNTVFVERPNGSDRQRNSRKVRQTNRFSKDGEVPAAVTSFTWLGAHFGGPVRTLRVQVSTNRSLQRTPAMAAGLTDHIWPIKEWLYRPSAVQ